MPRKSAGEQHYRLLVESVTDYAIFMLDPQGHVATWNRGAERIKGYRSDEILGQSFERFYPAEAVARRWPAQELELASRLGRFEDEGWRVRKDGTQFWANVVITALRDPSGKLEGFAKVTRDLTERRAHLESLRRSEERLRLLVDGVQDVALYLLDNEGRVSSWNAGAERIEGWSAGEIVGQDFARCYTPEDQANGLPAKHLGEARAAGRAEDTGWRMRKDGTRFWAHTILSALRDGSGQPLGFAKVTKDITDRKRVVDLEHSRRQVDEFLAMLGHELRNPLAPIRNAIDLLQSIGDTEPDAVLARNIIDRQSAQLARLVDDLLDVSRITRGKISLRLETVDAREIVERAVESSRPFLDARRHHLELDLPGHPARVHGDIARLSQVMLNLLNNAAKYTLPGGHIHVAVATAGGECVLRVRDDGMGIHAELMPRIFDLFVQGERGLDRSEGGLGLGLALVRKLVEAHGGHVEAFSAGPGDGSEFVVRLPLAEAAAPTAADQRPGVRASGALRILVVDDNHDTADSAALLLRRAGYTVRVSYDGPDALRVFGQFLPDVVLLDIGLPGLTGFDLATSMRARQGGRPLRLLAVTGYGQESDRERSQNAGFDAHLVKPVMPEVLLGALSPS
ncbi:MAG TPA: PAS domain S-box protein [Planctomycetota bacterium]|nr:PAS domain S-box protein [Planctomycetota bacterium]